MVDAEIVKIVQDYLLCVQAAGISPVSAVLYGSAARGEMHQWSDIDVVIVSPAFDEPHSRQLLKKLWRATVMDSRIEPVACGARQWETDESTPILEVARQEGILIEAA